MGTWLWQQLRGIAFFFDNAIYSLISTVYELIIYLANIDLVTRNEIFYELVSRIYLLLGIFMLFKVSFSIIQYLVDPNAFSEKGKGFGKLIVNALVSIVLLVATPFIFDKAYEFQGMIIKSNVINDLVLGTTSGDDYNQIEDSTQQIKQMARDVQFTMFGAFYSLNTDVSDKENNPNGGPGIWKCEGTNIIGSKDMAANEPCMEQFVALGEQEMTNYGVKLNDLFKTMDGNGKISDERDFSKLGNLLNWKIDPNDSAAFTINYTPIISTITGGYLLFLLLTFCIDIAARAFKLLFLQAVAPIAIISYIDPKENASNSRLKNWAMECFKTFLSLFLRLLIVFLAIRLVQMLTSMLFFPNFDESTGKGSEIVYYSGAPNESMNIFIYVFLILGIFTFAKQVPKMIESIFGIKMSGEMSLNPFKAISGNAGATGLIAGAIGLGAGGIAGAMEGYRQGGLGRALASGAGGALTGAVGGTKNGLLSGGKGYIGKGMEQGGRVSWNMYDRAGTSLGSRLKSGFQQRTGAPMESYLIKEEQESYKRVSEGIQSSLKRADEWGAQHDSNYIGAASRAAAAGKAAEDFEKDNAKINADIERIRQDSTMGAGAKQVAINNLQQNLHSDDKIRQAREAVVAAQADLERAKTRMRANYFSSSDATPEDAAVLSEVNREIHENSNFDAYRGRGNVDYSDLEQFSRELSNAATELSRSDRTQNYNKAEASSKRRTERARRNYFGGGGK